MSKEDINPRYACYCASQRIDSVEMMIAADRDIWPGGVMAGYILWNNERIREFAAQLGSQDANRFFWCGNLSNEGHHAYDAWLKGQFPGFDAIRLVAFSRKREVAARTATGGGRKAF